MADYTYATASKNAYEQRRAQEEENAQKALADYAAQVNQNSAQYKQQVEAMYAQSLAAQEAAADQKSEETRQSYQGQLDANAVSQLARERHLKEQMANLGLQKSGYNATNQTALAVMRGNADAATRTARQQAMDAIAQDLQEYKTQTEMEKNREFAEQEAKAGEAILKYQQDMNGAVHDTVMDQLRWEADQEEAAQKQAQWEREMVLQENKEAREIAKATWEQQQEEANRAQKLKEYVDDHNTEIYKLMLTAYNQGNAALGNEYAKQLWMLDDSGIVVPMAFDTTLVEKYVETFSEKAEAEKEDKTETENKAEKDDKEDIYNAMGFPVDFEKQIKDARDLMATARNNKLKRSEKTMALALLSLIRERTERTTSKWYMDEDTFEDLLRYVGTTKEEFDEYEKSQRKTYVGNSLNDRVTIYPYLAPDTPQFTDR